MPDTQTSLAYNARASDMVAWYRSILDPAQLVELRGLNFPDARARSAYFSYEQIPSLVALSLEWESLGAKGVYFVLNPVRTDLAGSRASARDADVLCRRWLLVDIDPIRDADKASTDIEREAGWRVADQIDRSLKALSMPSPFVAASGNGWHLLYPIDLPNNEDSRELCRAFLKELSARFSNDAAKVDSSTFNASRICRFYGTLARKGPATDPTRPHRRSMVHELPVRVPADADLLRSVLHRWQAADEMRKGRPTDSRQAYALAALENETAKVAAQVAGSQNRNKQLFASAAALGNLIAGGDLDRSVVIARLSAAARANGLPETEIEDVLRRAIARGESTPRTASLANGNGHNGTTTTAAVVVATPSEEPEPWEQPLPLTELPPAAPFPVEVFPESVRRFVDEVAWAMSCPADFVAVPLLAIAGGAIGSSRRLSITRSHHQGACLFVGLVGEPGTGKSPAIEHVVKPLERAERRFRLEWQQALREWRESEPQGERPKLRRCLADDPTTEALVSVLADNPRGLVMVRDELSALVDGMNQYRSGGRGHDRQVYLKFWSGSSIRVDRKSNPDGVPVVVSRPFLAIAGNIQPAVIERFRNGSFNSTRVDDGFLDRFLLAYPDRPPAEEEHWREVSEGTANAWDAIIQKLLSQAMMPDDDEGLRPRLVGLDADAKMVWLAFTRDHANEVNHEDFPSHLRGVWAKLRGYCVRLALVLYCLRSAESGHWPNTVSAEDVQGAWLLIRYFQAHARRVYCAMDADPLVIRAREILKWVARHKKTSFSRRDLFNGIRRQSWAANVEAVDSPLGVLVGHAYIRPIKTTRKPGRPTSAQFEVNPNFTAQYPQYPQNSGVDHRSADIADIADMGRGGEREPDLHSVDEDEVTAEWGKNRLSGDTKVSGGTRDEEVI